MWIDAAARAGSPFPCGTGRREFIWEMGAGFAGVALAGLLEQDGFFARYASAATVSSESSLSARAPHFPTKVKSVIFLLMNGGPSQVDTFDPKPALEKYAGQPLPPDKKFINSGGRPMGLLTPAARKFAPGGESGLPVSDFFPHLRQHADKLAVIRSCYTDTHAHGSALLQMNTGKPIVGRPSLGSWSIYGLGSENQNLPGYVVMLDKRGGPIGGQPNWSSGFMPATYQGTLFRPVGNPILDLAGPAEFTRAAQRQQLDLLAQLNDQHLNSRPGGAELAARSASYELAFRMQSEAPEAVDLTQETASTLDAYGVNQNPTAEFGRNCLIARRLVERGVKFVQLYSGGGHLEETWDAHENVEKNHGRHAGETDQPIAALLADLEQRGLLESTLVIWGGEFGRMPFSEGAGKPGRNHNPYGFSMWLAGGGVKGGMAYGATDEFGFTAVENRVHVHDLHATILHLMGIDHTRLTYFHQGRDERLTDVYGNVVKDILA
ncbi:DUF1501 domain-containing protein [Planctomicrobium piriforme]|uniref:Tat (Twin-arginine translocation) pathway signal sequence n=1 Tax=Planctomicrobium piriforme TaxID=1576369 RepID=A0A1I3E294_9PLAN|nr:DUF1501 domain-containing protein [Planctomicrobium piriforme]SFH92999.1 Protein of unknown function [Planctomicrobium piriforme]